MSDLTVALALVALFVFCVFNLSLTIALIRERGQKSLGIGGPRSGAPLPTFAIETHDGMLTSEHATKIETILVLAEESCASCKTLIQELANATNTRRSPFAMRIILAWRGEREDDGSLQALRSSDLNIEVFQYGFSGSSLGRTLGFNGSPGACMIDSRGRVVATGVASVQSNPLQLAL